jgi:ankyrin repeat protein
MFFPEIFFTEKSRENMTGLHLASLFGVDSLVEKILDLGHSINAGNARGQTPLHMAAMSGGQTSVARILLASPAIYPDARDVEGYTPLHVATALGAIGIVGQLAVRTDVDVNAVDEVMPGPTITMIPTGLPGYYVALDDVVQLLMEKIHAARVPAGPDEGNVMDPSSTLTASNTAPTGLQLPPVNEEPSSENDSLVSVRLKVGRLRATPSYQDRLPISSLSRPHGRTALHNAARIGNTDIAKMLLNNPSIQIDIKDGRGMTPLHKAAKYGHLSIVKLLMDRAGVTGWEHSSEQAGRLPIHLAVKYGHMHVVAFFVSQDKELVNAADNEGNTILHHSIYVHPTTVIEGILKYDNVMPDVRDKCGKTPLWKAIEINNIPVVSILQQLSDVNQDPTDNEGRRPNEARSEEEQQVPLPPTNNTEMPLEQLDSPVSLENLVIG